MSKQQTAVVQADDKKPEQNGLITRLLAVFGAPENTANPELFIAEYRNLLSGYGPNVLAKAGNQLIRNGGNKWPTPRQCVDACNDAQESIASIAASMDPNAPRKRMPWEVNQELAAEWANAYMAQNPLAEDAIAEGWGEKLRLYASSFARQCLNAGRDLPAVQKWKPSMDVIADYRRYRV